MDKTEVLDKIDKVIKTNKRFQEWINNIELAKAAILNYYEWGLLEITVETKKDFILCRKEMGKYFSNLWPQIYPKDEKTVKLELTGKNDMLHMWLNIILPLNELPKEYRGKNCYIKKVVEEEKKEKYYYECKLGAKND